MEPFVLWIWAIFCWGAGGNILLHAYKFFVEKKYPPKKYNGGFFVRLVGEASIGRSLRGSLAAILLTVSHSISLQNKTLWKILSFLFWPLEIAVLSLYVDFANEQVAKESFTP